MAKAIIKEISITLFLLVIIILIFGILFYDYIPNNKIAPAKVQAYKPTEDVQNELADTLSTETQNIVKTYYVDSSDLSLYESTKDYDKGKRDPFATYKSSQVSNVSDNNTNTISNNSTASSGETTNTSTPGRLFDSTGKNQ